MIQRLLQPPSTAVCSLLDGQFIDPPGVELELGRNVFRSAKKAVRETVPQQAIFVYTTGGGRPREYHQDVSLLYAQVNVIVRSTPNDFSSGEDLARGVLAVIHRGLPEGYISCLCDVSEPDYGGEDSIEAPYWVIPVSLQREE